MKNVAIFLACLALLDADAGGLDFRGLFPASVKCVSIVAPSSRADAAIVEKLTNGLSTAGYRVKVADSVWNYCRDAAVRARDLEKAWADPETDLILCARGGKGGFETVTNLDFSVLRSRNVPFVGFSNISTLLNAFVAKGVHHPVTGPMGTTLVRRGFPRDAGAWLSATLAGKPLRETKLEVRRAPSATVTGKPIGGHWPSISRMTPEFLPDTTGRIAFLEINRNYTLASATNTFAVLKRKGYFTSLAAAVLCDFGINGTNEEREVLRRHVTAELDCPVFSGFPYGHVARIYAVDFERTLSITPEGILSWAPALE